MKHTKEYVAVFLILLLGLIFFNNIFMSKTLADSSLEIYVNIENRCKIDIRPQQLVVNGSKDLKTMKKTLNFSDSLRKNEKTNASIFVDVLMSTGETLEVTVTFSYLVGNNDYEGMEFYKSKKIILEYPFTQVDFAINEEDAVVKFQTLGSELQEYQRPPFSTERRVVGNIQQKEYFSRAPSPDLEGTVYVLVEASAYGDLTDAIWQYVQDISEKYTGSVWTYSGNDPNIVRSWLSSEYDTNPSIVGCLFVSDIPAFWYEIEQHGDWDYEIFPCDLFYMDLNGIWSDSNGNGVSDQHSGDTAPEIWIGRLKASTVGNEITLINNYFSKIYNYRHQFLAVPNRALVYIDDDWIPWADSDNSAIQQIYRDTLLVKDSDTTIASDYKTKIAQGWEWVHLRCHGSAGGHTFKDSLGWDGRVSSSEYLSNDFPVLFYQLFVCSGARFTSSNYLGGATIFSGNYGLLSIGSTKTGSMLYFEDFYGPISEGKSIGAAFKQWFINHGESSHDWFYGLTILGDPTLIPSLPYEIHLDSLADDGSSANSGTIIFDGLSYSLPNDVPKYAGNYAVTYNPLNGYSFVRWEGSDGVYPWDENSQSTTITVWSDYSLYSLRAIYHYDNKPPTLLSGGVNPNSGSTSTTFTYEVTYRDPEGSSPSIRRVYIDGSSYTMSYVSGSYSSGALYRYQTTLSEGSHNYYFYFSDGIGAVRLPSSGSYSGPIVSAPLEYQAFIPDVHDDGLSWVGFLGLMNAGDEPCTLTFDFYDSSGAHIGTESTTLNSYAHYGNFVRNILGSSFSGTIKVTCDQPFVGSYNKRDPAKTTMMSYNFISDPFPSPTSGYVMLVPHVHDDGANWIGFLGLMNVGSSSATVNFEFYDGSGVKVSEKTESLNPDAHYGRFIRDIQGGYFAGAVKVVSNQPFVGSFTQRDPAYNVMCGYDFESEMPTPTSGYVMYVPHVHDDGIGWFGFLGVMNAGGSTATVTFQFYDNDGVLVGSKSETLNSYAHYGSFVSSIVGSPFSGSMKISSTQPIVGSLSHRNPTKTVMIAYCIESAQGLGSPTEKEACIPHVHDDASGWNAYLSLVNTGDSTALIRFEFYDNNGLQIDERTINLGSNVEYSSLIRDIRDPSAYFIGSIRIVSNQPFSGVVTHRNPTDTVMMAYDFISN